MKHVSGNLGRKIDAVPPLAPSVPITRSRKTVFFARDILAGQGYTVVRNGAVLPPVDLVAWRNGGDPVLIQVRRTRRPFENARMVAGKFHTDLKQLGRMPIPRHAKVQVWLYSFRQGWKMYDVHPGGLMEADRDYRN
ncbi:MAG TPA: hypothetical protein VMC42_05615 [Methanoregulaceae archaeon]|nr:hypothetical protein [Methanoregulaceae archaeon]